MSSIEHSRDPGAQPSISASMAPSTEIPGDIKWQLDLLPSVMKVSIFGGSITFSVLVAKHEGSNGSFTDATITTFLSIAWLFFALALVIAWGGQLLLGFKLESFENENEKGRKVFLRLMSLALQLLVLISFLFLSLVVVCYSKPVGWLSVGFIILFIGIALLFWTIEACGYNRDS